MNFLLRCFSWLRGVLSRRTAEADMTEELRQHLELRAERNLAGGMSPSEAQAAALRTFGGLEQIKERCREQRPGVNLEQFFQDVRHGARLLAKQPLFSAITILTLSLGIGVNAGVFTLVNGLMLRARIDRDPETFVHLAPQYSGRVEQYGLPGAVSLDDFRAYAAGAPAMDALAGWAIQRAKVDEAATEEMTMLVTANFFSVYGLKRPLLGRVFSPEECSEAATEPVMVLSEEIWERCFGRDPEILGRKVKLDRIPFTVVGVLPANFAGRLRGRGIWIPYSQQPNFISGGENFFQDTTKPWLTADGRLGPTQNRDVALAQLVGIARERDRLLPGRVTTMMLTNGSLSEEPAIRGRVKWVPPLILAGVSLVLLLTCVNVAMLLLARASARRHEIAVRLAVGATRGRLVRMLLTESLLIALAAGVIAAAVAFQMPTWFSHTFVDAPNYPMRPNWVVFGYLAGLTLVAGILAGLAPALESMKVNLLATLMGSEVSLGVGRRRWHVRELLIAAQVSVSVLVLVGAGFFVRAQRTMFRAQTSFDPAHVTLTRVDLDSGRYTATTRPPFYEVLAQRLRAQPQIEQVCFASAPPGNGGSPDAPGEYLALSDEKDAPRQRFPVTSVSSEFFSMFRISTLAGRIFSDSDIREAGVVGSIVVSAHLARALWPEGTAVGQRVFDSRGQPLLVIGVVADTKSIFGGASGAEFYRPWDSRVSRNLLLTKSTGDGAQVVPAIRNIVESLDPNISVGTRTLQSLREELANRLWVIVRLIVMLATVALLLATIGIYGVVGFWISRRTKELGIRLALGASRLQLFALVFGSVYRPILAGLGVGLLLAIGTGVAVAGVFEHLPAPVRPWDPVVFVVVAGLMMMAACLAMVRPAMRITKIDPLVALRSD